MFEQDFMVLQYKIVGAKKVKVGNIESSVSNTDMQVYWYLHNNYFGFVLKGQDCFISQETIGSALNLSVSTVKRSLRELEDIGLLAKRTDQVGAESRKNTYAVLHYTLALFDDKKIEGVTPTEAFYDPLSFEESPPVVEFKDEDDQILYLFGGRHKAIHWSEISEKDVPY